MRKNIKGKVMFYIFSKLECFFTHSSLLNSGKVALDCPQTGCIFNAGVQNGVFHVALRFQQGNGESLQTAEMNFVMVSHDITADGASRGCETNPL